MRVVHVCGELGTYGAENVVAQLVSHTNDPAVDVSVLTLIRWTQPQARGTYRFPITEIDRRGRGDVGFFFRAVAALRRLKPDVVHTHAHHGRYWGRLAAVVAGVPIVVHTEHNPDLVPPRPRALFDLLNRVLARRTTAYVDFTEQRRAELAAAEHVPVERIAVIPNGMDVRPPDPAARERARTVLGIAPDRLAVVVVARLWAQKRHDLAIDAFASLPDALRARTTLFIAGEGPLRADLEAQAEARGVADSVRFLGFRADARELLAGADVSLLTSAREAMPLVIIEAMLEGAPIVTTPWAGARTMLGENRYGLVSTDFTPDAIAAALRDALENRDAARARAQAALAYAQAEYDVDTQAARYVELYRALSSPTRAASELITAARS
jgi:glycosyltransferase involved in cell wall biosynthesis